MWDLERSSENYEIMNAALDIKLVAEKHKPCNLPRDQEFVLF